MPVRNHALIQTYQNMLLKHKTAGQQKAGNGGCLFSGIWLLPSIHSPLL